MTTILPNNDIWSDWLLHGRQADDPEYAAVVRSTVDGYVDRVLDGARLALGMTLVDVGAGEGVLTFRAVERIGSLEVILTDISVPMLRYAESAAVERGIAGRCRFIECSADNLSSIADSSVDAVATRAVLAYVDDKRTALGEFYRVLKPGGRISLCEPILQDEAFVVAAMRMQVEANRANPHVDASAARFLGLMHRWKSAQLPDTEDERRRNPLVNFSERDLLNHAVAAGFVDVRLQLEIDVRPSTVRSWDVFLDIAPHPFAPTPRSIMAERFTAEEREFFERMYRPTIESGRHVNTDRITFLTARKP